MNGSISVEVHADTLVGVQIQEIEIAFAVVGFIRFIDLGGGMSEESPAIRVPEKEDLVCFIELFLNTWSIEIVDREELCTCGTTLTFREKDSD